MSGTLAAIDDLTGRVAKGDAEAMERLSEAAVACLPELLVIALAARAVDAHVVGFDRSTKESAGRDYEVLGMLLGRVHHALAALDAVDLEAAP